MGVKEGSQQVIHVEVIIEKLSNSITLCREGLRCYITLYYT